MERINQKFTGEWWGGGERDNVNAYGGDYVG